jgi:DNA modification methylase
VTGHALVLRSDARSLPLPDASVDLIVTSPPYFALRSYTDGGEHYAGQIGSEATPAEWLDALWACTREWVRVLKPTGSIFVNLGDKYSDRAGPEWAGSSDRLTGRPPKPRRSSGTSMAPRKSLLGLPWRYALGCIDDLDLILRAEVIWSKPNGLPESITDRVRRSHETWFHFVKHPRYYAAVDEIREPHARAWSGKNGGRDGWDRGDHLNVGLAASAPHPLGALPGSVWSIPSEPLTVPDELGVDHFAAFPTEWPRRLILGWSPPGICTECGEGRWPVTVAAYEHVSATTNAKSRAGEMLHAAHRTQRASVVARKSVTVTGYACACTPYTDQPGTAPTWKPWREYHLAGWTPPPTRPAVILDPFGGSGTTALVASTLSRIGVSADLSYDYSRLAQWRTADPGERAKALRVAKPPAQASGQEPLDLFGEEATA